MINVIMAIFSLIATMSLDQVLKTSDSGRDLSVSVLMIVVSVGIFLLIKAFWKIKNRRLVIISAVFGFLFSVAMVFGKQLYNDDTIAFLRPSTYFGILGFSIIAVSATGLCMYYFDSWVDKLRGTYIESVCMKATSNEKRFLIIVYILIIAVWGIGLMASYPGVFAYDSIYQIQYIESGPVTSHHPVLHTYILGGLVKLGESVFGSAEIGGCIYSLIQMTIMAGIFTYMIKRMKGLLPDVVRIIVAICFAVIPYNIILSFAATKDTLFAGVIFLVFIRTYDLVQNKEKFFKSKRSMTSYILLVFLMCALKNNGIYSFMVLAVILVLLIGKGYRVKSLIISCAVILIWNVYTGPIYGLIGVESSYSLETINVPAQQLSRAMNHAPENISDEDKQLIEEYVPDWRGYVPRISDNTKNTFNKTLYESDKAEFIKLWIRIGLDNPGIYIDAWASLSIGYWYTDMIYPDPGTYFPYLDYYNTDVSVVPNSQMYKQIGRATLFPKLSERFEYFVNNVSEQNIPLYSLLFSPGIMFWIICFAIVKLIYERRYRLLIPLALLLGLWLTLILAPAMLFRYAYPLVIATPFVFAFMHLYDYNRLEGF
ncbi:MAG: DUF6020 family protein [Suipraeoptans sp.]